jgi:hypothetical protein
MSPSRADRADRDHGLRVGVVIGTPVPYPASAGAAPDTVTPPSRRCDARPLRDIGRLLTTGPLKQFAGADPATAGAPFELPGRQAQAAWNQYMS